MTTPDLTGRRVRTVRPRRYTDDVLTRPLAWRRFNIEVLTYVGLVLLSLFLHLWLLGHMAMHHDEALHANFSWQFFTGQKDGTGEPASFPCWSGSASTYCYNPVYHGPTLYLLMYLSYFLFGVSEATARLPMALAGVGLIASCWMLRPLFGRRAALFTALLMLISPTLLYFTRFARHDALAALWTFWIIVGLFRFMQSRRAGWLYLAAAATALLWATHELVFIVLFVIGSFVAFRYLWERLPNRTFTITLGALMLVCAALVVLSPNITIAPKADGQAENVLHLGGMGLLGFLSLLTVLALSLRWGSTPLLRDVLADLRARSGVVWSALGVFLVVFAICFTTFFTYPRGFFDGFYAGLAYWFGSQHSFARGDQPWYYYFMQLGIYEMLPVLLTLIGLAGWIGTLSWRRAVASSSLWDEDTSLNADTAASPTVDLNAAAAEAELAPAAATTASEPETVAALWVGFLFHWFFVAFIVFSWAGEKMPWLTIHMTLPAVIAGGWALDRIWSKLSWATIRRSWAWLAIPLAAVLVILLVTAMGAVGLTAEQQAQQQSLGALLLVLISAGIIGALWSLSRGAGRSTILRLSALGVVAMLAIYTVRATALVVYVHPDVPVELLVYTQTAPDVPIIVDEIEQIAIAQSRNNRSVNDPTGGHTMPLLISDGDPATRDGSLHQPFDWYLRDWSNVQWLTNAQVANITDEQLKAPVAIFSKVALGPDTPQRLEQAGYVKVFDTVHNWWFPEWDAGYKDRLHDPAYGCDPSFDGKFDENGHSEYACSLGGLRILTWPLHPSNWQKLRSYLLYRELPEGANLGAREMVVYVRRDAAPLPNDSSSTVAASNGSAILPLLSEGPLDGPKPQEPRGVTTGPDGSVYVADAGADQILVYATDGTTRVISGTGDAALLEPSQVAVDAQGNVYVTDTWHARVAKFDAKGKFIKAWGVGKEVIDQTEGRVFTRTDGTAAGNQAEPLGFFGPRGLALDPSSGHLFIADTGNKRIVVTDLDGNYLGQIGTAGSAPGQFNEPIGLAINAGNLYVGDSWNGRIQVFPLGSDGLPVPNPAQQWRVPNWNADTYFDPFLAADPEGRVVVTIPEQNVAAMFDNTGELLFKWGGDSGDQTALKGPSGVAFAPDGSVYVAEKGAQQVQRWVLPKVR